MFENAASANPKNKWNKQLAAEKRQRHLEKAG